MIFKWILKLIKRNEFKILEITDPFTGEVEKYYYKR